MLEDASEMLGGFFRILESILSMLKDSIKILSDS